MPRPLPLIGGLLARAAAPPLLWSFFVEMGYGALGVLLDPLTVRM